MTFRILLCITLGLLAACGRGVPDGARVVVAGDSVMAWNRIEGGSLAQQLHERLGEPVGDVSLPLAKVKGGRGELNIPTQLAGIRAEWVVLNGGANDLGGECRCTDCDAVLNRLISDDGARGAIPTLVADLRRGGAKVVWADYYTSPRYAGTACETTYRVLERRLTLMAEADAGVMLVDMDDVFRADDLTLFDADRTHPSPKGSALIAALVAPVVAQGR